MALANFFRRNAVAAAQLAAGYDEIEFTKRASDATVGVTFGRSAVESSEGRSILDMTVRLLARLYPRLGVVALETFADETASLRQIASEINADIDFVGPTEVSHAIAVGPDATIILNPTIYVGSNGWDASLSTTTPRLLGNSANPFGAGAAAALGCGAIFNSIFLGDSLPLFLTDKEFSTLTGALGKTSSPILDDELRLNYPVVLVGGGAIGNSVIWALSRSCVRGDLHIVDPETLDLSNLQRYVLASQADQQHLKTEYLAKFGSGNLRVYGHPQDWSSFVSTNGYDWKQIIVAVDNVQTRRLVQASLPRRIVNSWTQRGDLGISEHGEFGTQAACVSCLYLPETALPSEDVLVAQALGVPERVLDVRALLHLGQAPAHELLDLIRDRLNISSVIIEGFRDLPIRQLYAEGICGGGLVPPSGDSLSSRELHVPLAHQSALAGVLAAAAAIRQAVRPSDRVTRVTRIDVNVELSDYLTQPARADATNRCICHDSTYRSVFQRKYSTASSSGTIL